MKQHHYEEYAASSLVSEGVSSRVELLCISAAHRTDHLSCHITAAVSMNTFIVIFILLLPFLSPVGHVGAVDECWVRLKHTSNTKLYDTWDTTNCDFIDLENDLLTWHILCLSALATVQSWVGPTHISDMTTDGHVRQREQQTCVTK